MSSIRDTLREHQQATGCSDSRMLLVVCGFLAKLDGEGQLEPTWHENLLSFVVDSLQQFPGERSPWEDPRFTDEDKNQIIDLIREEISDCAKELAFDQAEGEDMVSLVGYACDNSDGLVGVLEAIRGSLDTVAVTGEFIRSVDEDDREYSKLLDFAVRMKLINEAEDTVTELGDQFVEMFG